MIKENQESNLLLGAVGFTNAYLNSIYFKGETSDKKVILKTLAEKLTAFDPNFKVGLFQDTPNHPLSNAYERFARSDSAYKVISQKEILFSYDLGRHAIDSENLIVDGKQLKVPLFFSSCHLYFFEHGNAVILASVDLKKLSLEQESYERLSFDLHKAFQEVLKPKVLKLLSCYQELFFNVIEKYFTSDRIFKLNLLQKDPLLQTFYEGTKSASFSFAIFNHFFDQSLLPETFDVNKLFDKSECIETNVLFETHEASIRFGYTHSIFQVKTEKQSFDSLLLKYRLPLLFILANWSAIRSLSLNLDYMLQQYQKKGRNRFNLLGLRRERDALNRYLLMFKQISAGLEGYSASNHPVYSQLIERYRLAFMENKSLARLNQQIEVTSAYSREIDRLRTQRSESILEFTLVLLASVSIFSATELFFKINTSYDSSTSTLILRWGLPLSLIFLVLNFVVRRWKA